MGFLANLVNSRFCLRIRRNETIQRTTRRMDKAPNGIWSTLPAFLACLAWVFILTSSSVCSFVSRNVSLKKDVEKSDIKELEAPELLKYQGIGFWAWQDVEGKCYSYTINGISPSMDTPFQASSALTTVVTLFGGIITVCLFLGTVFPIVPKHYLLLGYSSFVMCIMSFSTLSIIGSVVCSPGFFQYSLNKEIPLLTDLTTSSCSIGLGSTFSILSAVFWILVAFVCIKSPLGAKTREPGAYRRILHKDGERDDFEGEDDEATRLYRQRQAENEERYRQLMSDIDNMSILDDGKPSLRSQQRLSLVVEEASEEMTPPGAGEEIRRNSTNSARMEHEYFDDENSEARSQFSDEDVPNPERVNGSTGLSYHDHQMGSSRGLSSDGRPSPQSVSSKGQSSHPDVGGRTMEHTEGHRKEYDDDDDEESYSDDSREYYAGHQGNENRSLAENSDLV